MFAVLPASTAVPAGRAWTSRLASLALHAVVIAAAVHLTDGTAQEPVRYTGPDTVIYRIPDDAPPAPAPPPPGAPTPGTVSTVPALVMPDSVPDFIPPPGDSLLSVAPPPGNDPPGAPGGDTLRLLPGGSEHPATPIDARAADEAPRLLDHPPLRYPEVMRQAGLEARVVVEAVLDTTGRIEPGSLRLSGGAHALFEAEARAVVTGSRYRPARLAGRAVRVRIQVPVAFSMRR